MEYTPQEKMLEVHVSTGGRRFLEDSRSNSAVAAINKWLKSIVGFDPVEHRLRHNFKDLL
jgi:hypothetical protein